MERQQAFTTMLAAIVDELLDAMDNLDEVRTKLDTIQLCMILLTALLYVTVLLLLIAGLCYCVWRQNNPGTIGNHYYQADESPSKRSRSAAGAQQKPLLMKYQNVNHSRYKDLPHFVVPNITVSENIDDSDDERGGGMERMGEESGISVSGSPRTIRSASEKKLTSLPEEVV